MNGPGDRAGLAPEPDLARARLLLDVGRPGEAVPVLQRVVAGDPASVEGWLLLSAALLGVDRPAEALEAAARAAALAPGVPVVHVTASRALVELDRHDEAVAAARVAVRLEPDDPAGHCALARALLWTPRGGREAWDAAARAARLAPGEPEPHAAMGAVALVTGHHEVAEAAFRRVLSLRPDDAAARHGLGLAAAAAGRDGDAMRELTGALAADPTLRDSRDVLERLWDRALLGTHLLVGFAGFVLAVLASPAARAGAQVPRGALAVPALVALGALLLRAARFRRRLPERARPAAVDWVARDRRAAVALGCLAVAVCPLVAALALPAALVAVLAAGGFVAAAAGGVAVATRPRRA